MIGKRLEYLERAVYVCPFCGLSVFESKDDIITCKRCKRQIRHLPSKELEGVGFEFPYRYVADWYEYQEKFVSQLSLSDCIETPMYRESVGLWEVILFDRKRLIDKKSEIELYGDRFVIMTSEETLTLPFAAISAVTVLGKNKLNIYFGERVYQIKGDKRFNALKYVNLFYHEHNLRKGEQYEFLGL